MTSRIFSVLPIFLLGGLLNSNFNIGTGWSAVDAYSQADLYSLMDTLFTSYKPEVRPTTAGEATYVYVDMQLLSIQNLDERSQELETAIILNADWHDDYLSWNASQYGGLSVFLYPQSDIWLPDIVIENSVKTQKQLGYDENKVRIFEDGLVAWNPSAVIKTGCDIDVTYYPFDTQTCNIIISTWMSDKSEVDVDPESGIDGLSLDRYSKSGTWELVSNKLDLLPNDDNMTRFQYQLKLKRLRTYYVVNIIMPVLFLSFTASLVFFLPADAGEKIGMSITVLLAYAVYLTIISDNMPQTSLQVSYLAIYLTLLLGLTAFGVVLSVFVLHFHHKQPECRIGPRTLKATRFIRWLLCINRANSTLKADEPESHQSRSRSAVSPFNNKIKVQTPVTPLKNNSEDSTPPPAYMAMEEEITWPKVAEAMDRGLFLITSLSIALITVIFLSILGAGGS